MNLKEIHSAVEELCQISRRPKGKIDWGDVNEQFRRIEKAGLPINKDKELRGYRDRAYDRLETLKQMRSDAPERQDYIRASASFFLAIEVEAHRLSERGLAEPET